MALINFDTLEYVELLSKAGVDKEHAKAQARYLGKALEGHFATKEDIKELDLKIETVKSELKRDMGELKRDMGELKRDISELKRDINELKRDIGELKLKMQTMESRLTLRIVGYLAAIVAIFSGIQTFLFIYFK